MTTSARSLRYALPLVTAWLLLAACGSVSSAPEVDSQADSQADPSAPGCTADDPQVLEGPVLARVDVDGDGRDDEVRQRTGPGSCSGQLVVVIGDRLLTSGRLDGPPASAAFAAELTDGTRVLVTRQDHLRGGFQSRLHVEDGGRLVELTDDEGNALVPFVATDTVTGTPLSVTCADDGVTLTEAQVDPGEPTSLEVVRVTYRIEDGEAVSEEASTTSERVASEELRRQYPELAANAILEDCRAG